MAIPRGLRNNNPLNIRESKNDGTHWLGERATDDDPAFEEFQSMAYGVRAAGRILLGYQSRYKLDTIRKIVERWAPPNENDTGAYVNSVARQMDRSPDAKIDLRGEVGALAALIKAMARVELGADYISGTDLHAGVAMAFE